jgi:NAD(P)-dependent dehydrogenase (short-subunit alcohol dehydrogenase family)
MIPARYFDGSALSLEGTVSMVTGAASGIGRRTAERFAEAGASVIACDIAAFGEPRSNITYVKLDVTQEADWEAAVAAAVAQFGRIDALVNCAGIVLMGNVVDLELDGFRRLMAINVEGTFLGLKHVMRTMLPRGSGSIVNISSIAGINGSPGAGAYCASKGAVRLLTKSAALEAIAAGTAVRVNSIHPTLTDTPLIDRVTEQVGGGAEVLEQLRATLPGGRLASSDQIVDGILFLVSPQAAFCNGSELVIDNGYTAR